MTIIIRVGGSRVLSSRDMIFKKKKVGEGKKKPTKTNKTESRINGMRSPLINEQPLFSVSALIYSVFQIMGSWGVL